MEVDYECFEQLILHLRNSGHGDVAQKLHYLIHQVAWTTGSELLGELGAEILAFHRKTNHVSLELQESIIRCMEMVRRVWPDIK